MFPLRVTREGLVKGTLTEDGYIYTKQNSSGSPAGMIKGTLAEDGYIYEPESYGTTHDWKGPLNGWEKDNAYMDLTANYTRTFYKKKATAGTSGYIYQDAVTYDQYSYINDWGGVDTGYFTKTEAKAGTSGYIYQEGGKPTYSDKNTSLAYKSEDADLYYLTPYVNNSIAGKSLVNSINANMTQIASSYNKVGNIGMYVSALSMTSLYYDKNGGGGATYTLPYVYAQSDFQSATAWSASSTADQSANSQTVKAKQLNEGLITLYPYKIGDSLNISGTHQQVYALDLEAGDVTVWYTLAGSNNSSDAKKRSSLYAADPYDGMENYYIYTTSYGNGAITYCGAGLTACCFFGIPDEAFELLDGRARMITKAPIRLLTLSALELNRRTSFWDIGFCTGSVSIEARLQFPHLHVTSFEIRPEGKRLMEINSRRFGTPGITTVIGDFLETDTAYPVSLYIAVRARLTFSNT